MNIKTFKDAVAKKCRQCVGPWSGKYDASPAELIDVCDKTTCGLYKVRPRIIKETRLNNLLADILE